MRSRRSLHQLLENGLCPSNTRNVEELALPARPLKDWQRVRLRVEDPAVERDEVFVGEEQEEVLQPV
jgi:hypothetical protein